jgi:hypothetical protein
MAQFSQSIYTGPPPMVGAMKAHLVDLKYPAAHTISKVDDLVNNQNCQEPVLTAFFLRAGLHLLKILCALEWHFRDCATSQICAPHLCRVPSYALGESNSMSITIDAQA